MGLWAAALVALSDGAFAMVGVVGAAAVTGIASVTGIVISTTRQRTPVHVTPMPPAEIPEAADACAECKEALVEMRRERDYWRNLAMEWMPHRRSDDN